MGPFHNLYLRRFIRFLQSFHALRNDSREHLLSGEKTWDEGSLILNINMEVPWRNVGFGICNFIFRHLILALLF